MFSSQAPISNFSSLFGVREAKQSLASIFPCLFPWPVWNKCRKRLVNKKGLVSCWKLTMTLYSCSDSFDCRRPTHPFFFVFNNRMFAYLFVHGWFRNWWRSRGCGEGKLSFSSNIVNIVGFIYWSLREGILRRGVGAEKVFGCDLWMRPWR